MTPRQCRAARAMLRWNQARLAVVAGYAGVTVGTFEKGGRVSDIFVRDIAEAFRRNGVLIGADTESVTYAPSGLVQRQDRLGLPT